jgi:transketolase
MRPAFAQALFDLAAVDPRVVLLTGDLGYSVLEPFRDAYPDRYFNVGVAEQNMIGMATGLAEAGFVPFAYSIATFATMRPFEFIRNGAVLHNLPVRVVGVGAGFDYGPNGITHYSLEDVALMRSQPGMVVIAPVDREQARAAVFATADHPGPIYFRIAKAGEPVTGIDGRFEPGRATVLTEGSDLAIVALGNCARHALDAADVLATDGIDATVIAVASVAPAPAGDLAAALSALPLAVSVEAHYVVGGLGSLVAEVIATRGLGCRLVRCGPSELPRLSGSQEYLYDVHGLSVSSIVERVRTEARVRSAS